MQCNNGGDPRELSRFAAIGCSGKSKMDVASILIMALLILLIGACAWLALRVVYMRAAAEKLQSRADSLQRELESVRGEKADLDRQAALDRIELEQIRAELATNTEAISARDRELDDTREKAREASRTKSLFVANMSHELRTPLNGILGLTRNLLDSNLTGHQRSEVELIKIAGEDLVRIVNDVLDLSKLEAGRLTLEKVPFDFCELIEGAFSLLYPQAERKQLVYGITYSHLLPRRFLGDPFRMRQVALNLLSNAIKFTQSGSVFLHAEQGERRGGAVWMKLSVEDTGIGIDEAKLRMIFDEFQQADPSTTRKYGGTGLGLSLSRRIVDLMGGEISAESEVNRGSRFVAQIPLFPLSTTASDSPNTPSNPLEGIRLLVQDRHSPQSKALRRLLETLPGVEIQLFQTEEEAVNRLNAHVQSVHPVDAIISSHRSTSFSPEVAQAMLRSGGMTAPIHILLNEQSGYVATRTASSNNTLTIQAPILPSRVFAVLNQLRRLPVGPLFESAGLTALDVYRDAAALPSAKQRPTLVAHANPVELRLLEAMLQKLGVSFESVRAEDDLLPMLRDRRFKALVVHGQLLKNGVPDALVSEDREMEQDLRVMVVGEVDDAVARCLAESYTAFAHYENAPRVSQLRDFLTA